MDRAKFYKGSMPITHPLFSAYTLLPPRLSWLNAGRTSGSSRPGGLLFSQLNYSYPRSDYTIYFVQLFEYSYHHLL